MLIRSMLTTVLLVAAGLPSLAGAADAPTTSPDSEPVFSATVSTVPEDYRDRMIGVSWKPGCPVPIDDLRIIDMNYWGFDGSVHDGGLLMVHKDVVDEVCGFTGKDDPHDDQVDALAAAVAALRGSSMAEALSSFAQRQREAGSGWALPKVG